MVEPARSADALTLHDVERLARYHQGLTGSAEPDRIIEAFAPDVVVRFADFPEIARPGRTEAIPCRPIRKAEELSFTETAPRDLAGRSRPLLGRHLGDGRDGRLMEGHGVELMTIRDGKITLWEAVFNVWEQGKRGSLPIV